MNKVVIVTGASRGIGRQIAIELSKKGYKVIANYNKSEKDAKTLQNELLNEGINIDIFRADVSLREQGRSLVEFALNKYGQIDALINNAGISEYKLFTDETDEDWERIIKNNLYSAFMMSQEVVPNMIKKQKGCIINISSIWGQTGASMEVVYSVSKAGLDGFTKALAKELGLSNIRVNAISPGIINTQMNELLNIEEIETIKNQIPLGKLGIPKDIAKCVTWLLEDDYTTGQIISINGGWNI